MRYIYVLKHPVSGDVKYVGYTLYPTRRLRTHISGSHSKRTKKEKWIAGLLSEGLEPVMEILEQSKLPDIRERYWIKLYREQGAVLVNGNEGGNLAPRGTIFSDESRAQMSQSAKDRCDDEFRQRMSATMQRTMSDPLKRHAATAAATKAMSNPTRLNAALSSLNSPEARANFMATMKKRKRK